ncbi:MAG: hydrogenase 4 subunit B [Dehalococcoidia bacterium]|nr:hydrogenase 4 subunit B [Dehalococcoidia bacterium]
MSIEPYLSLAPVAIFLLGSLLAPLDRNLNGKAAHLVALIGSTLGVFVAVRALLLGLTQDLLTFPVAPFANLSFRIDPLSAFFLLVICIIAVACSIYAIGYVGSGHGSTVVLGAAFNGFIACMILVVLASSVFAFLFAWEAMSLVSFILVVNNHRHSEVRRSGYIYLVMTHAGTAFLVVGFFVLYAFAGSLDFEGLRTAAAGLPSFSRDLVFLAALVGFGTKAGIIPLHIWLPRAHPAAPSHVSALMSGVMIKTAIYGLLRVCWDLIGPGPAWWGGLILALGVVSSVLGVLHALMQHDLKRLLAYHSVENIGIILIGLGAAFLLFPLGQPVLAALALLACLYHVLNHAVFKALLFLGAGAVQHVTRTRDMEALGGLIRYMPWTAASFLVGAVAISALPPLNGFVSEWLTFQSLLALGASTASPVLAVGAAIAAGCLALTGGLAAFCFVKAFGITFLGMPRSDAAKDVKEVGLPMLLGMGLLSLLCLGLGLFPSIVVRLIDPVTLALAQAPAQPMLSILPATASAGRGAIAPLAIFCAIAALGGLALILGRVIGGVVRTRTAPPWSCGIELEPSMQYSATAFAKPIRIIFRSLIRPYREVKREHSSGIDYFVSGVRYEGGVHPIYERYLYQPAVRTLLAMARHVRLLQNGSLRTYLIYIFATLVVVLLLTR